MPIAIMLMLELLSPSYINVMTSNILGQNLLGAAVCMQIMGYLVMRRMIKVEV
jgi:Flp pilus assembly protein TadB